MNGGRILTPSTVFSKYCTPIGKDGKFLCDAAHQQQRGLQSSTGSSVFDIENALEAAAGTYPDMAVDRPPMEENIPVDDLQQPSSTIISKIVNGVGQSSPEALPLIIGSLLIIATVTFTIFTLFVVFDKWKENHKSNGGADEEEKTYIVRRMIRGKGKYLLLAVIIHGSLVNQ